MGRTIRLNEDIYGLTDLRKSLPQVVAKANETKRPMVITKRSQAVAAIVDIDELQQLYDRIEELEMLEDRRVVEEFEDAEARGEISWLSDEEMGSFLDQLVAEARRRA
ncbi:MAG: type II toxin-antitoxin system Phd/YefM family antitoxin [Chloroflexota bacterium]